MLYKQIFLTFNPEQLVYCPYNLGELWVIEEFCPFGNLHRYLLLNRHNFVNELDDNGDISVLGIENDQQESFSLPKTQCNQDQ